LHAVWLNHDVGSLVRVCHVYSLDLVSCVFFLKISSSLNRIVFLSKIKARKNNNKKIDKIFQIRSERENKKEISFLDKK
jgi:hypothetical protein